MNHTLGRSGCPDDPPGIALRSVIIVISLVGQSAPSWAVPGTNSEGQAPPVVDAGTQVMEEIVITARKRTEPLAAAPAAVYALGAKAIEQYAINDIVSAAKLTPGLVLSRSTDNSSANIYLRGVGTSFTSISFEQAVSINIDNVPINKGRAIYQGLLDMEQVEVMRGPQALYYGKNSTAGVVAIRTANPSDEAEYLVRGGYEVSGEQYYGELVASAPLSKAFGVRLALRGSSMQGGYFDKLGEVLNGVPRNKHSPEEDEYGGRLTIVYQPSENFDVNVKLAASTLDNDGINGYTQLIECQGPGGTPQPIFGVPNEVDGCQLDKRSSEVALDPEIAAHFPHSSGGKPASEYTGYLGAVTASYHWDGLSLTSVTGYYDYETWSFANFDLGSASQIFGREMVDYTSLTEELRLASEFESRFNFIAGLFYDDTDLNFSRAVRLFTAPPDPATGRTDQWDSGGETDGNTYSAFLELGFEITPSIDLSGGARYSQEEKDTVLEAFFASASTGLPFIDSPIHDKFDDDDTSLEATLRWRPNADTTLFVSYKEGYKSGGSNLSEIPFLGTTAETIHFDSEEAKGIEAGIKGYLLGRSLYYGLTLYQNTFDNLQVSVFDPVAVTLHVDNAGKYRTQGVEIDASYTVPYLEDLSVRGSVYYNKAEYQEFIGTCYTGQTIAAGCNQLLNDATGAFTSQDYEGRPGSHAPEWTIALGGEYTFPVSDSGLSVGASMDARYTDSYYLSETLSPYQAQGGYVDLNAVVRVYAPSRGWEVALIGRNLTDELAGANAIDHPATGFGTGTDSGLPADTYLVTGRPREVAIQATWRF